MAGSSASALVGFDLLGVKFMPINTRFIDKDQSAWLI